MRPNTGDESNLLSQCNDLLQNVADQCKYYQGDISFIYVFFPFSSKPNSSVGVIFELKDGWHPPLVPNNCKKKKGVFIRVNQVPVA